MSSSPPEGVLVVVLTFNAPDGARACIDALQAQTVLPASILVVDNCSTVAVDEGSLDERGAVPVQVLRLSSNSGPAGGYAAGLDVFRRSPYRYAWVMDDDVGPEPDCLDHLLREMAEHDDRAVVGPVTYNTRARETWRGWGWWGALVPREAVVRAGVPDARLFWGLEDQEYLRDRLPLAGYPNIMCEGAVTRVVVRDDPVAPWKHYYLNRNLTYRYLYRRRHIPFSVRGKSLVAAVLDDARKIRTDEERRLLKWGYLVRGVTDGVFGRLGRRVSPGAGDRPWGSG